MGTSERTYSVHPVLGLICLTRCHPLQSLLTGSVLEAICSIIAGLVGHFMLAPNGTPADQLTPSQKTGGDTLIAFAVLHVFSYSIFWGPTPWVYLGESFPLRVRPKAIALGSATSEFPTCHIFPTVSRAC